MSKELKDYITYHFFTTRICPRCHKEVDHLFNYCPYCGFRFRKPPSPPRKKKTGIEDLTLTPKEVALLIFFLTGLPITPVILNLVFGIKNPLMLLILTLLLAIPVGYAVILLIALIAHAIKTLIYLKPVKRKREAIRR